MTKDATVKYSFMTASGSPSGTDHYETRYGARWVLYVNGYEVFNQFYNNNLNNPKGSTGSIEVKEGDHIELYIKDCQSWGQHIYYYFIGQYSDNSLQIIGPYIKSFTASVGRPAGDMASLGVTYVICPNGCTSFTIANFTSNNPYDGKGISSVTNGTFSGMTVTVTDNTQDVTVKLKGLSIGSSSGYYQTASKGIISSWD